MHPHLVQLLLVPGDVVKELLDHKCHPATLEGACVLVALKERNERHQLSSAPPRLSLVRINKVQTNEGGSHQLEVGGAGPDLQAYLGSLNTTQQKQPGSNGSAPSASQPGTASTQHGNILSSSACTIGIDQVASLHLHELRPQQAILLCTLLAARLAVRADLPDQQRVYNKACHLRCALMYASARRQGCQPNSKEAQALVEWQRATQDWLSRNWSRLQEEQAEAIASLMVTLPTAGLPSINKATGSVMPALTSHPACRKPPSLTPLTHPPAGASNSPASLTPPTPSTAAQPKLPASPNKDTAARAGADLQLALQSLKHQRLLNTSTQRIPIRLDAPAAGEGVPHHKQGRRAEGAAEDAPPLPTSQPPPPPLPPRQPVSFSIRKQTPMVQAQTRHLPPPAHPASSPLQAKRASLTVAKAAASALDPSTAAATTGQQQQLAQVPGKRHTRTQQVLTAQQYVAHGWQPTPAAAAGQAWQDHGGYEGWQAGATAASMWYASQYQQPVCPPPPAPYSTPYPYTAPYAAPPAQYPYTGPHQVVPVHFSAPVDPRVPPPRPPSYPHPDDLATPTGAPQQGNTTATVDPSAEAGTGACQSNEVDAAPPGLEAAESAPRTSSRADAGMYQTTTITKKVVVQYVPLAQAPAAGADAAAQQQEGAGGDDVTGNAGAAQHLVEIQPSRNSSGPHQGSRVAAEHQTGTTAEGVVPASCSNAGQPGNPLQHEGHNERFGAAVQSQGNAGAKQPVALSAEGQQQAVCAVLVKPEPDAPDQQQLGPVSQQEGTGTGTQEQHTQGAAHTRHVAGGASVNPGQPAGEGTHSWAPYADTADAGSRGRSRERQGHIHSRGRSSSQDSDVDIERDRSRSRERDRETQYGRDPRLGYGQLTGYFQQEEGSNFGVGYKRARSRSPNRDGYPALPPYSPHAGQYDHAGWAAYHPPPMQGCGPAIDPHWKRPRPAAVHLRPSDYSAEKEAAYTRALLLFMACNYPPSVHVPTVCLRNLLHTTHVPSYTAIDQPHSSNILVLTHHSQHLLDTNQTSEFPVGWEEPAAAMHGVCLPSFSLHAVPDDLRCQIEDECTVHIREVAEAEQWAIKELHAARLSWLGTLVRMPYLSPDTSHVSHLSEEVMVVQGIDAQGPGGSVRLVLQQPGGIKLWAVPAACVTAMRPEPGQAAVLVTPVPAVDEAFGTERIMCASDGDDCRVTAIVIAWFNAQQWQMACVEWGARSNAMQCCRSQQLRPPRWVPLEWLVAADVQTRRLMGLGIS